MKSLPSFTVQTLKVIFRMYPLLDDDARRKFLPGEDGTERYFEVGEFLTNLRPTVCAILLQLWAKKSSMPQFPTKYAKCHV